MTREKISGIKQHLAVDIQGLPYAFAITSANVTDRSGALFAFEQNKEELRELKGVLCDGGYSGKSFADAIKPLLEEQVDVQVVKQNELHTFTVIPKRWIVKRCFAQAFEKQRRLVQMENTLFWIIEFFLNIEEMEQGIFVLKL